VRVDPVWRVAGLWFLGAALLYAASAARGLIWADSSKLTFYALAGYFPSLNPGDHAGWTVVAWVWLRLFGGDPVVAAHRLSAACGALLPALAAAWFLRRGESPARAHGAAAILLVGQPLWWAAAVAETYALALAATLAGALAVGSGESRRRGFVGGLFWGLAAAAHGLALFLVVPLALESRPRRPAWLLAGLGIGAAPVWLALFHQPLDPLTGFQAAGAASWSWHLDAFLAIARIPRGLAVIAALVAYGLGPVVLWAWVRTSPRRRIGPAWRWSLALLALFLATYAPFRLHLMSGFLLAGLVLAVAPKLSRAALVAHVLVQVGAYLVVPWALGAIHRGDLGVRVLPHRDNATYFLSPIKRFDRGPERFLEDVAACAPVGAAVVSDFNPGAVLRLAQVARGWRPDLEVLPVAVDMAIAQGDPAAALEGKIRELGTGGRVVVVADRWEPYYRIRELSSRLLVEPCAAGARIRPALEAE
jgi:hypothetical protein